MNIYVGNLAYKLSEADLRSAFEEFGEVDSVRIITDRATGRSKGFGFVEMPDAKQAKAAIEGLNGSTLAERTLKVNEARPRRERNFRDRG
jgi:RNA recognition motif-containing protein